MRKLGLVLAFSGLAMIISSIIFWPAGSSVEVAASPQDSGLSSKEIEWGRALFLGKGCATCHNHDGISAQNGSGSIGPNLSHYQPDPVFLRQWLEDPNAIKPGTQMPDLDLQDKEIAAIISFLEATATNDAEVASSYPPTTCPVTAPPEMLFVPPGLDSSDTPYDGYFWYGSEDLWTLLRTDGIWSQLPRDNVGEEPGYVQKLAWWRKGYDWRTEQQPDLIVTGRRLDAPAPPMLVADATNGYHEELKSFMLAGAAIPTLGCWEITGHYGGNDLSYIVWITP